MHSLAYDSPESYITMTKKKIKFKNIGAFFFILQRVNVKFNKIFDWVNDTEVVNIVWGDVVK